MILMTRVWAMPNKWTFKVPPLLQVVRRYMQDEELWIDPFAGTCSPAHVTNDLNPALPADFHLEAEDFVNQYSAESVDGVIFDPPYSITQVALSYKNIGAGAGLKENPTGGFPRVRDAVARVCVRGGTVISFGWNTVGMGKSRGFEPIEYLICSHGGNRNDTLVVVERRLG